MKRVILLLALALAVTAASAFAANTTIGSGNDPQAGIATVGCGSGQMMGWGHSGYGMYGRQHMRGYGHGAGMGWGGQGMGYGSGMTGSGHGGPRGMGYGSMHGGMY